MICLPVCRPSSGRLARVSILLVSFATLAPQAQATGSLFAGSPGTYVTGPWPTSVAIGDLNGDGNPDLVVANSSPVFIDSGSVSVLLGHGDGTFGAKADYWTGYLPYSVAVGDLNGDRKADVVVANPGMITEEGQVAWAPEVAVLLGNGDGSFASPLYRAIGKFPAAVAIGDLNGDGRPDLVVADRASDTVSVLLGNDDGTFGGKTDYRAGNGPVSVAIADLNGDDRPDLVVANEGTNTVSVLLGNGDGSFGPRVDDATGNSPHSVTVGDLNGDGRPDLAVGNGSSNTVSVLLGNGDGSFGPRTDYATGSEPYSVAVGDLDGDGRLDLVLANYHANAVSVLLGNGDGSIGPRTDYATGYAPFSVAVGDLNRDGRLDLAVANVGSNTVSVLLNTGGGGPTPTLLSRFEARWVDQDVELRWQFGPTADVGSVTVERSTAAGGPWLTVNGQPRLCDGVEVLVDSWPRPGRPCFYRLQATFATGKVVTFGPIEASGTLPAGFVLLPIGPNPSHGATSIAYTVPRASWVRLSVLDVQGHRTAVLVEGQVAAGRHALGFDAASARAGLYFVRLEWPGGSACRRLAISR